MPRHLVRSHSENPLYPRRTRLREILEILMVASRASS